LDSDCTARDNTCDQSGLTGDCAGIFVFGNDNRIEGNNCTDSDRGIHISGTGNIIIRNTCSGNTTDWFIVANNVVGPIIDRRVLASAAIDGFSAPSSLGTTTANANFSY
jgi:parallel beta-helix repeat protein